MGDRNKRVFALLSKQHKTRAAMARALNISKSAISQWEKNETDPTYEQCQLLAPFFGVTIDYLMTGKEPDNKEWEPSLTAKDERDIQKRLEETLNQLDSNSGLMFSGEPLDDETKELLKASLETTIRNAKLISKKKFTPNKFKK